MRGFFVETMLSDNRGALYRFHITWNIVFRHSGIVMIRVRP